VTPHLSWTVCTRTVQLQGAQNCAGSDGVSVGGACEKSLKKTTSKSGRGSVNDGAWEEGRLVYIVARKTFLCVHTSVYAFLNLLSGGQIG